MPRPPHAWVRPYIRSGSTAVSTPRADGGWGQRLGGFFHPLRGRRRSWSLACTPSLYAKSYWRERLGLSSGQNNRDDEPEARLEWVLGSAMLNRAENARTGTWHEVTGTYP